MKALKTFLEYSIIYSLIVAILWQISGITIESNPTLAKYAWLRIVGRPMTLFICAFICLILRLFIFQREKKQKADLNDSDKIITVAQIYQAYSLVLVGILSAIVAVNHLFTYKSSGDFFLFLLLASVSFIFTREGFRTAALSYDQSDITISALRKKFVVPFVNLISIERKGASFGGYRVYYIIYKVLFITEAGENTYLKIRVPPGSYRDLKVLASLVKLKNPSFIFEDLM